MKWYLRWKTYLAQQCSSQNQVRIKKFEDERKAQFDGIKGRPVEGWVIFKKIAQDNNNVVLATIGVDGCKDMQVFNC